jgi:hypothetical protein
MPDIYLRMGAATLSDILLRDPTQQDVDGFVELAGVCTVAFAGTGMLAADKSLIGNAQPAFVATTSLSALKALSGAAQVVISATGLLAAQKALAGVSTVAIVAEGKASAVKALAGAASAEFICIATLTVSAHEVVYLCLEGSSIVALSASGVLSREAALIGEALSIVIAEGKLSAVKSLAGMTEIVVEALGALGFRGIAGIVDFSEELLGTVSVTHESATVEDEIEIISGGQL